jgi:hypothetical protein
LGKAVTAKNMLKPDEILELSNEDVIYAFYSQINEESTEL